MVLDRPRTGLADGGARALRGLSATKLRMLRRFNTRGPQAVFLTRLIRSRRLPRPLESPPFRSRLSIHEAHIPPAKPLPLEDARISGAHEDQGRPQDSGRAPQARPQASHRFLGLGRGLPSPCFNRWVSREYRRSGISPLAAAPRPPGPG